MAELDSIRTIVCRVKTREENLYIFLTLLFSQYLYADLTICRVSMVIGSATAKSLTASSPAWLDRDITSRPSCLDNIIVSMTQQRHHATTKLPRQHHRQHDSAETSCHGLVASTASSPAWLSTDIASWPSCLGSAIARMTWHRHRLGSTIASMTRHRCRTMVKLPRLRHCHHDSGAWHLLPWLAIWLRGSPLIKLGGLRSTTPSDSLTRVHFYLHRRPRLEVSASSPQCYGTLHQIS
jgi:hypothetical protein